MIVTRGVVIGLAVSLLAACGLQTEIIQSRHWDLNEMIRNADNEQLLINIVRLRYDETPYFLQIGSITTSFSSGATAGVSGTIPQEGPNVLGLNAGVSYSESPTVTWALPDSRELLGRLHAPMGADQLTVLTQSGLDASIVLRVGAKKMNRLRNLEYSLREGIYVPDTYDEFIEMLALLDELLRDGVVELTYGVYSTVGGGKIPLSQMDTQAMADALPSGMQFMTRDNPNEFEPLKLSKPLFLRFTKQSDDERRASRLRELLDLDPTRYSFAIVDTSNSGTEQLLSESGRLSRVLDPDVPMREIVVNNRSVMEVLRFASTYVEVPREDLSAGIARVLMRPNQDWLNIKESKTTPSDAWISVEREGIWYFISNNDVNSRISFTILNALFSSVVGEIPGAKPLLTLPVK